MRNLRENPCLISLFHRQRKLGTEVKWLLSMFTLCIRTGNRTQILWLLVQYSLYYSLLMRSFHESKFWQEKENLKGARTEMSGWWGKGRLRYYYDNLSEGWLGWAVHFDCICNLGSTWHYLKYLKFKNVCVFKTESFLFLPIFYST